MQKYLIRFLSLLFLICSSAYAGQEPLTTEEIHEYLADRKIEGNQKGVEWNQSFSRSGYTAYAENRGMRPSSGNWKAINNQYCSQWPPSLGWDCYDLTVEGDKLTFIPKNGDPWPAVRLPKSN